MLRTSTFRWLSNRKANKKLNYHQKKENNSIKRISPWRFQVRRRDQIELKFRIRPPFSASSTLRIRTIMIKNWPHPVATLLWVHHQTPSMVMSYVAGTNWCKNSSQYPKPSMDSASKKMECSWRQTRREIATIRRLKSPIYSSSTIALPAFARPKNQTMHPRFCLPE